jgi:uncharacterized membrane protein
MTPGQNYSVSVTMTNTGNTTWNAPEKYRLGSKNPQDNTNWGFTRVSLPAATTVAPGQSYTFNFTVKAPATPNIYAFQWRMVRDGVAWFGDVTPSVAVNVSTPTPTPTPVPTPTPTPSPTPTPVLNAVFVSQSVPNTMTPGQTYSVSVTMTNTGNTTWNAPEKYRLGSKNPQDNTNWGFTRVSLPAATTVAPGQSYTFNFTVKAPGTPNTYAFQWRMVREAVAWFGDSTPSVAVNVR